MKVLFVCSGNSKNGISPFILSQGASLIKAGIVLEYFPIQKRGVRGYFNAIFQLRKKIRNRKYDVIHAHYGLSALIALFAKKKECLVVSFMGDDILGANRVDGTVKRLSLWLAGLNKLLAKYCYHHVLVKSEEMLRRLAPVNASLIPNGVDVEFYTPGDREKAREKLGMNAREKYIIFVSNPSRPEKNFSLAERSIAMAGIPELKLIPLFDILPEILLDYFRAANALVLTSFHEGSPNVVKEAMACNCPIVSTRVGDVEWIFGCTEGYFTSSFSADEFAGKIKNVIEFTSKNGLIKGRDRIIELGLDVDSIAEKIVEVYKKVQRRCAEFAE